MGLKGYSVGGDGVGEIVEVQGGHIIRATGRKDRHSKVFTSKGPRDRRVRLSAHTAIQFYDVQDRLGYDRPSKAVDWLIKKAKSAIDKLDISQEPENNTTKPGSSPSEHNLVNTQTQFVAANLDSEDAMKTFFPATTTTTSGGGTNMNFQNYPHHRDGDNIVSRTRTTTTTPNLSQDLGLSLHPFQGNNNNNTVVPETNNLCPRLSKIKNTNNVLGLQVRIHDVDKIKVEIEYNSYLFYGQVDIQKADFSFVFMSSRTCMFHWSPVNMLSLNPILFNKQFLSAPSWPSDSITTQILSLLLILKA